MDVLAQLDALEAWAREGEHHPSEWVARLSALRESIVDERAYAIATVVTVCTPLQLETMSQMVPSDPVWIGPKPSRQRKPRVSVAKGA